jgi:hypothetical protein
MSSDLLHISWEKSGLLINSELAIWSQWATLPFKVNYYYYYCCCYFQFVCCSSCRNGANTELANKRMERGWDGWGGYGVNVQVTYFLEPCPESKHKWAHLRPQLTAVRHKALFECTITSHRKFEIICFITSRRWKKYLLVWRGKVFGRPLAYEKAEVEALLHRFRHEQEMADENFYCEFLSRYLR